MYELSEFEEEVCDHIVEGALDTAVRLIFNMRPCAVEDIDNEVRIRMIGALENGSPYGSLH
jgi:hypothetical protein